MSLRRFMTRVLGLCTRSYTCQNGPMAGEELVLTENSGNTAWLEVRGQVGRYVTDPHGKLVWEPRR